MKEKRKIYLSIPISGLSLQKQREKADLIMRKFREQGHEVVNPFEIYAGKNPTYEDYICYDLRAMLDCDTIFFCHGWQLSLGCNIERDAALRYKKFGKKNFTLMYEK